MADTSAMSGKGKILVVDDDRLVLATVTHGLARAGFDVIDADNGDDAILLARQHRPDLALLDIRMEGKSGFDVADYLRESLGTPFMFLSAFADAATVARVKELGAVAYLVKPLDIAQIVPTVEAAVAAVRARRGKVAVPGPAGPAAVPSLTGTPQPPTALSSQAAGLAARGAAPAMPAAAAPVSSAVPASAPAPAPVPAPPAALPVSNQASALADPIPLAVGVLMHRYSLPRAEALARLVRLADTDGRSLATQAAALIDAVELLARPGNA